MAVTTVENLEFHIKKSGMSSEGAQVLKDYASALEALQKAKKGGQISQDLVNSISALAGALKVIDSKAVSSLRQLSAALKTFEGLKGIKLDGNIGNSMLRIAEACDLIEQQHIEKLIKFGQAIQYLNGVKVKGYDTLPASLLNIAAAVDRITDDEILRIHRLTLALSRLRGVDLRGVGSVMSEQRKAQAAAEKQQRPNQLNPAGGQSGRLNPGYTGRSQIQWTWSLKKNADLAKNAFAGMLSSVLKIHPAIKLVASVLGGIVKTVWNIAKGIAKWAFKTALSVIKKIASGIKNIAAGVVNVGKNLIKHWYEHSIFKQLEDSFKRLSKLISSFGRVAMYRVIRSAIKYITDELKEGTENAYWFSREFGKATHYISEAYDNLASKNFKMSNQLGAAWSTLIATIEPILIRLINMVTKASEAVTQFFAILGGSGTYLKAVDYNKQWADSADEAAEAAKEWKNQLMSFDTLNRLNDQTDTFSGSAGKYKDYQNMFEEAKVEGKLAQFFGKIKEMINSGEWAALGKLLGDKFNSLVTGFDWSGWGSRIGKAIQGAADMAYNFLKSDGFRNLGYGIMQLLDNLGSEINFETLGRLSMRIKTALWDVFVGAVDYLSTPGVAKNLAIRLSNFVIGALTELAEWIEGLDPYRIAYALKEFFGNIRYEEIKNAFVRVVSSAWSQAMLLKEQLFPDGLLPTVATHISKWIDRIDWNSVGDTIVTNFNRAWNFISDQFDKIWPPEKRNEFINKVLQKASEIITTAVPAIHNILMYNLDAALFGKNWAAYHWSQGDYAGKEIIMGLIHGTDDKMGDLEKQMEDVSDTVTDTTKRMLNIGSPSKVFETIGQNTMAGFLLGLSEKFKDITSFFSGMVSAFSTVGSGLVSALQSGFNSLWGSFSSGVSSLVSTLVSGISSTVQGGFSGLSTAIGSAVTTASGKLNELASAARTSISTLLENSKTSLNSIVSGIQGAINGIISKANSILAGLRGRSYATGGFPEDGLFFANHSELVGQFSNGKTAVANNEQIVSGIKQGVYQAVREALGGQSNGNDGQPLNVYIGDELVYSGFAKYSKRQQLMSGGRA